MSDLKMFPYVLQVFVCNVWCCTVSNFYHACDISIIALVVVSCLCVYLICWVTVYAHSWINIYRGWTNNGNTRQYRNKTLCWLYWKNISCICAVPVSMHYRLCLVTVCMEVLQNGRLIRLSKKSDCWCTFSWSFCNQNSHFMRCIQSSSFQGYDDIYKSWQDIIS